MHLFRLSYVVAGLVIALLCGLMLAWTSTAEAAPTLQLPWPADGNTTHYIYGDPTHGGANGGNTYGCGDHDLLTANDQWGDNADYYGLDFQFTDGQTVAAASAGTVTWARDLGDNYGLKVVLNHSGYLSVYAHLSQTSVVENTRVAQGQTIGLSGHSGFQTGPHLHFHMQQGLNAFKPEPMSNIPGPVYTTSFGQYGGCTAVTSPSWTSRAPYVGIEGTLIQGNSAAIYVIDQGTKRPIPSIGLFTSGGYQGADVSKLDQTTVDSIPNGFNVALPCPGTLVKTSDSSTVWAISGGWKSKLMGSGLFTWCYPDAGIVTVSHAQLDPLPSLQLFGPPCPYIRHLWYDKALLNGTLVVSGGSVYVIEASTRRPIPSSTLFESCGYLWPDLVTISSDALNAISLGTPVSSRPCPFTLDVATTTVYASDTYQKRAIAGAGVIDWCGFFWSNVVIVSQTELNSVGNGNTLYSPPCPYGRQ